LEAWPKSEVKQMALKKQGVAAAAEAEAPEFVASAPDEYALPAEGFVYFLLAQLSADRLNAKDARVKMGEYLQRKAERQQDRDCAAMRLFLGRVGSGAAMLAEEAYVRRSDGSVSG
jgi:hypothetical protein